MAPNGEAQRAHLESARATTVSPRLRTTTQLASHSHHQHTLPALQFTHAGRHFALQANLPQPTGTQPTHTTTHTSQPPIHSPTSTAAHTPPPTPNRPTLQPHSSPSGQADSAHKTENSLKLPVVGSQHTESEILPGAAVQQRNSKDTPMMCQRASFLNTFRRGSQRADVALAGRHRRALLWWDVPRIGGPDRRTLGGQYRANRSAGRTPSARCTPGRGRK